MGERGGRVVRDERIKGCDGAERDGIPVDVLTEIDQVATKD